MTFRGETVLFVELYAKMFQTKYVAETRKKCQSVEVVTASINLIITVFKSVYYQIIWMMLG